MDIIEYPIEGNEPWFPDWVKIIPLIILSINNYMSQKLHPNDETESRVARLTPVTTI
jgi:hypothetical protein